MDGVLDLIACVWQEHVDASSEDEPSEHRWRILRNAHASSALPGMGVTLDEVVAYGRTQEDDEPFSESFGNVQ